jgi:hypothetical protein
MIIAGHSLSLYLFLGTTFAQSLDSKLVGTWATKANSTLTGLVGVAK